MVALAHLITGDLPVIITVWKWVKVTLSELNTITIQVYKTLVVAK